MKHQPAQSKHHQLLAPRDRQLIYTEAQPVDSLTDPVDDPCGVKCKGGSCNQAVSFPEQQENILIF